VSGHVSLPGARRRVLTIAIAVGLTVAASGAALAATGIAGTSGSTLEGCYNTSTGALSLLTAKHKTCGSGEKAVSWNQVGPKGPQGIQGKTGPQGPKGAPGISTAGYFTGGEFAASLGSPAQVASLSLPAGSYVYSVSVDFDNATSSSDNVTCTLTDASGRNVDSAVTTVGAGQSQAIPITGASTAAAGTATVECSDSANSASASVNGAAFTATTTASLPTAGHVLRTGSLDGTAVAAGNAVSAQFLPSGCTSGSVSATVKANPEGPGAATLSITSMTFSGCSVSSRSATITANDLPYSLTVSDQNGDLVTSGAVSLTVIVPSLTLSCTYSSAGLQGHWDNSINGITLTDQTLTYSAGGVCASTLTLTGNVSSVKDTSVTGSPLLFDN
jgi:hypothetical protein